MGWLTVGLGLLLGAALACGPIYQKRMLGGGGRLLHAAPSGVAQMFPKDREEIDPRRHVQLLSQRRKASVEADLADLKLAAPNLPVEIIAAYKKCRTEMMMTQHWTGVEEREKMRIQWGVKHWKPQLPREFQLYLEGAIAYFMHNPNQSAARDAWKSVLALPRNERLHRTTWAQWMLARTAGEGEDALALYDALLGSVEDGFSDSLNLKTNESGWRAYFAYRSGHFPVAIDYYLAQGLKGTIGSVESARSLRTVFDRGMSKDGEALMKVCAKTPERRLAYSLYLTSRVRSDDDWWDEADREKAQIKGKAWLVSWWDVLQSESKGDAELQEYAGLLVAAAYRVGWYEEAEKWAKSLDGQDANALWVLGKLQAKSGKFELAEVSFEQYLQMVDPQKLGADPMMDFGGWNFESKERLSHDRRALAYGDYASILLARKKYSQSLRFFLLGGFYTDAAYIAESLMDVQELLVTVRALDLGEGSEEKLAWLEGLLARRLVRENYFKDAQVYFDRIPKVEYPKMDYSMTGGERSARIKEYISMYRHSRDPSLAREKRAEMLWEVARMRNDHARSLFWLENGCRPRDRATKAGLISQEESSSKNDPIIPPMSPDELSRLKRYGRKVTYLTPVSCYDAAELAWEAAHLLPRQDPRSATMLWQAGVWIADQDPKAADRYYQELVTRCGQTPLGQLADEKRWFPVWRQEWALHWPDAERHVLRP